VVEHLPWVQTIVPPKKKERNKRLNWQLCMKVGVDTGAELNAVLTHGRTTED
jgi:hypothetical protein